METPHPTPAKFVHIFFMDGVGLGDNDADTNPFIRARLPHLTALFGADWYLRDNGRFPTPITTTRATLIATDANLGLDGRPQSATGQATILTGRNIPAAVGEHYGPKPNPAVAAEITKGTLFHDVVAAGGTAALLSPYPQGYFDAIASGKRLYSAVPLAATSAGLSLMDADDLRNGRAVSPGFTGQGWRDHLGYDDIPLLTLPEAGQRLAAIAQTYTFSFFEHWPSDRSGHRGPITDAAAHLEMLDTVIGSLIANWNDSGLLIITSDHGNIEAKDHRQHTRNPVPTILVGHNHAHHAATIHNLTDIATVTRSALGLPT